MNDNLLDLDPIVAMLFPYQKEELLKLAHVVSRHPCVIESGDPGTGKTKLLATLCHVNRVSAMVICPIGAISGWFSELENCRVPILGVSNYDAIKTGKYFKTLEEYINKSRRDCPYVAIEKVDEEIDFDWDFPDKTYIIVDEAHKGKNNITINSQLLISLKKAIAMGENKPKMFIVSATIADKIECFRVPAYLLGMSQLGKHAYAIWLRQLKQKYPNLKLVEAVHKELYPEYGSRMRKVDLKQFGLFKENYVRAELIEVSPEIEREISAAYADIDDAIRRLRLKEQGEMNPLTAILRARQRIEMLKLPAIGLVAMEKMLSGKSVICAVNFNESIDNLFTQLNDFVREEFDSFVTFIRGEQTPTERNYAIDSLQSGKSRVMILNIQSGSECLNLHHVSEDGFPVVTLISPPWSSIKTLQMINRTHRVGALSDSEQIFVYCRGKVAPSGDINKNDTTFNSQELGVKVGVEELIAESLNKNLKNIEYINNGTLTQDLVKI